MKRGKPHLEQDQVNPAIQLARSESSGNGGGGEGWSLEVISNDDPREMIIEKQDPAYEPILRFI